MKKILFGLSAFTMLFATSCQNDLDFDTTVGKTSTVSFSVGTPEIATRAYSDGTTATNLQYAVYDAAGNQLTDLTVTDGEIHGSTTVKLQLTTGNTYSVIFWAAAPQAPYTVDFGTKTMTVDYKDAVCNAENRDAFYKYHTFTVKGAQTETIELKRPFAQLNIGTADYAASKSAGYTPTQSAVVVKNVYSTLNLETGDVDKDKEVEANFALADIKKDETFPVADNEYLAMNYLLVGAEKETVEVEFTYTDGSNAKTRKVGSVPVQRNYRTNIYGNLLTSEVDVNVEIKPEYDGTHELDALYKAALNGGQVTLTEDVELTAPLEVVSNMVLDLNGHTITTTEEEAGRHHYAINNHGTMILKGASGSINARGIQNFGTMTIDGDITITNVDTNGGAAVWNEGSITINGGTFTTNNQAGVGSYGGALNTRPGGTAIVNGGNFIANSQLTYAIINEGTTTINDAMVKGKHGAVSGSETNDATVINGGTFELMENPGVSDHCTYYCSEIRGGKFTLGVNTDSGAQVFYNSTIADGFKSIENNGIYNVVANDVTGVKTADELAAALTAENEKINVVLQNNIDLPIASLGQITGGSGEYKLGGENTKNITIDLNGHKLNITTTYWSNLGAKNDKALFTIKNGTMTSSQATGTWNSYDVTFSNCDYVIENVVFEKAIAFDNTGKSVSLKDVTINETHDYYAMWITAAGQNVTIDGLTINSAAGRGIKIDEQYVKSPAKVTLNINNAIFKTAKKAAIVVKSAAGAEINASNLNIGEVVQDKNNAVWVDKDASAYADMVIVKGASKSVEGN